MKEWKNSYIIDLSLQQKNIDKDLIDCVNYNKDEYLIEREIKSQQKLNKDVSPELTTRLIHTIVSINGETEKPKIRNYVYNLYSILLFVYFLLEISLILGS